MGILSFAKRKTSREKAKPEAETKKDVEATSKEKNSTEASGAAVSGAHIQLTPLVTEKSMTQHMTANTYAFRIPMSATKREVAAAVEAQHNVTPKAIKTLTVRAKSRRRGRTVGSTSAWKKAYVTLPEGKSIEVA